MDNIQKALQPQKIVTVNKASHFNRNGRTVESSVLCAVHAESV
jgi:hypothetical protein